MHAMRKCALHLVGPRASYAFLSLADRSPLTRSRTQVNSNAAIPEAKFPTLEQHLAFRKSMVRLAHPDAVAAVRRAICDAIRSDRDSPVIVYHPGPGLRPEDAHVLFASESTPGRVVLVGPVGLYEDDPEERWFFEYTAPGWEPRGYLLTERTYFDIMSAVDIDARHVATLRRGGSPEFSTTERRSLDDLICGGCRAVRESKRLWTLPPESLTGVVVNVVGFPWNAEMQGHLDLRIAEATAGEEWS